MKNVKRLIRGLGSIFPWIRKRAMEELVGIGEPAIGPLVEALDSPTVPRIYVSGYNIFSDSSNWRRYPLVLKALSDIGSPAIQPLQAALHHPNPNVRISAMKALEGIDDPSILEILIPFLDSTDPYLRQSVVIYLGRMKTADLIEKIIVALRDENQVVRQSAIFVLGNLGDVRALPELERVARTDNAKVDHSTTLSQLADKAIEKIRKETVNQELDA